MQKLKKILVQITQKFLPILCRAGRISSIREESGVCNREVKNRIIAENSTPSVIARNRVTKPAYRQGRQSPEKLLKKHPAKNSGDCFASLAMTDKRKLAMTKEKQSTNDLIICPFCSSKKTIKRGTRKKKYEIRQRYLCNSCGKSFVAPKAKGKSYPLKIIMDGVSYYNTGFTLAESCKFLKEKTGVDVKESSLANWVKEYEGLCRYSRMRPYGLKLYSPHQVIQKVRLFHRQVYEFCYHRAKTALILQEYKHSKFDNLREYLEAVQTECPHQFFKEGGRMSEDKAKFSLNEVVIREKQNFATRIANLCLQAVNDNKLRHSALQRFMLCNDSVTVATEVPVYMDDMDIEHMQEVLGFRIPVSLRAERSNLGENCLKDSSAKKSGDCRASLAMTGNRKLAMTKVISGHIDIVQIRNGAIHILDYKPAKSTKRDKPVSQLTLYALALSRLTGLRLYDFKCAWFDENAYYEFFPLHVVYKLRDRQKKEDPRQMRFNELVKEDDYV